jgi:integrase
MRNLYRRADTWTVRVAVPADLRERLGKREFTETLKTSDQITAIELAAPVVAGFKRQILEARRAKQPSRKTQVQASTARLINPDDAFAAIHRWNFEIINQTYLAAFNGGLEPIEDRVSHAEKIYGMQVGRNPDDTVDLLASILGVEPDHPALAGKMVRQWLREARLEAEQHIERFRLGDFAQWPVDQEEAITRSPKTPVQAGGSLVLSDIIDRFVASQQPPEAPDIRYVWRRFVEFHGDVLADSITPVMADEFAIAARSVPVTKQPKILALPMRGLIAVDHAKRLSPKSVWKWVGHINRVYTWAQMMQFVASNPFASAMPKKPRASERVKGRRYYKATEIAKLFNTPLFNGFTGKVDIGYREKVGDTLVKDSRYWLPILALWHGGRLEEFGGCRLDQISEADGIWHFDWTERKLKTPESSRLLPIHPMMKTLGFERHITTQREADHEFLFPDLPHDSGDDASTAAFSKWFGRWMTANGLPDGDLDFHAFRHTFKRACRDAKLPEEIHDLLTGHVGRGGVSRAYGQGAELKTLADALEKVSYPSFPLKGTGR